MKQKAIVLLLAIFLCSRSQADLFDSMLDTIKDTAVITATTIVTAKATELIVSMIIEYSTEQTKTEEQVSKEYEEENGALPATTTVSSYETTILPGASVAPGTEVSIKSVIAVVPGQDRATAKIEETLTIYDSEDTSQALKSMTKPAAENSGGEFASQFTFTLPEGMPQGIYPIRSTLALNGEVAGDNAQQLQLVLHVDYTTSGEIVAVLD
jgi:hypothetical protein